MRRLISYNITNDLKTVFTNIILNLRVRLTGIKSSSESILMKIAFTEEISHTFRIRKFDFVHFIMLIKEYFSINENTQMCKSYVFEALSLKFRP